MTPLQRGRRVAARVEADILPRLARWEGPVDLEELARLVAGEVEAALAEVQPDLFREEG